MKASSFCFSFIFLSSLLFMRLLVYSSRSFVVRLQLVYLPLHLPYSAVHGGQESSWQNDNDQTHRHGEEIEKTCKASEQAKERNELD